MLPLIILIAKILLFLAASLAGLIALAVLFFFDNFKALNDRLNNQFLVGKGKYGGGGAYALDSWVFGWRIVFGFLVLLISLWLFSVFFQYMSL